MGRSIGSWSYRDHVKMGIVGTAPVVGSVACETYGTPSVEMRSTPVVGAELAKNATDPGLVSAGTAKLEMSQP